MIALDTKAFLVGRYDAFDRVADGEMHHSDVEVIALSREIEWRGVSF